MKPETRETRDTASYYKIIEKRFGGLEKTAYLCIRYLYVKLYLLWYEKEKNKKLWEIRPKVW